jgi:hypothetical protein
MNGLAVSLTLFGMVLFGQPSERQIMHKAEGKVGGQYVTKPAFTGVQVYRQGRHRWTVCGEVAGRQLSGRMDAERFIIDKSSAPIFSGDPAFTRTPDDKDAFEALWRTRCVRS